MRISGWFAGTILPAIPVFTLSLLSAQVMGQPYSAISKTTTVQKLADGTTITHETTGVVARDSGGHTYRDQELPVGSESGRSRIHMFEISDPVNKTSIHWNSTSKVATVLHYGGPGGRPLLPVPPPSARVTSRNETTSEKLGGKTINGIYAEGTRHTMIIPAEKDGNDQPITVVHEIWLSSDLMAPILETVNDPRSALTTTERTIIERADPDPSLFRIPNGYIVSDQYPGTKELSQCWKLGEVTIKQPREAFQARRGRSAPIASKVRSFAGLPVSSFHRSKRRP